MSNHRTAGMCSPRAPGASTAKPVDTWRFSGGSKNRARLYAAGARFFEPPLNVVGAFPCHSPFKPLTKSHWLDTPATATFRNTMLALVKKKAEVGLWLEDIPRPTIGINDVLIKVLPTGICRTDLHIYKWDAWAQRTIPVPMAVGHE